MPVIQNWYETREVSFELGENEYEAHIQIEWGQDSFSHAFGVQMNHPHVEDIEIYSVKDMVTGKFVEITEAMRDRINVEVQP
jgi:hypothetical protein